MTFFSVCVFDRGKLWQSYKLADLCHCSHIFVFLRCTFNSISTCMNPCLLCDTVVVWGREWRPGGGSGPRVGVRRGLAEASWIILQPKDPPSPSAVSWTMRIKLLLFLNSENGRTTKTIPPGSLAVAGSWVEERREGRSKEEEEEGGRRRQGVHHKINPFTVSSGCKVRYEADMSNETLQSSKGTAIKAYI